MNGKKYNRNPGSHTLKTKLKQIIVIIFEPMKRMVFICCLLLGLNLNAQVFHFDDTTTTIIKTTAQSPAHWYIEIFNDIGVDTTLRWKTHFENIPPQWNINFETQGGYFDPVFDGDSADFILHDSLDFPQKLIIGAATANTPGNGSVFFDIYDPYNPTVVVTIEYHFIITSVGTEELTTDPILKILPGFIEFYSMKPGKFLIASLSGQVVIMGNLMEGRCDISLLNKGIYCVYIETTDNTYFRKFSK